MTAAHEKAEQALFHVRPAHREMLEIIVREIDSLGGSVSPQKALVPKIKSRLQKTTSSLTIDEKKLTQYIRKYEACGFFRIEPDFENPISNRLTLTDLGYALLFSEKSSEIKWQSRTLAKIEVYIRRKRSLAVGEYLNVNDVSKELLLKSSSFGLKLLSKMSTAQLLLHHVIRTRMSDSFSYDEKTNRYLVTSILW